jgi:L-lysine exporter family protein LysE/ArgO
MAISTVFFQGMGISGGLIIAIGAQNAYLLSLGIRREHHRIAALICAVLDISLIMLGVAGVGTAVASSPELAVYVSWGGGIFLFLYGGKSLLSVFKKVTMGVDCRQRQTLKTVVLTTLALTLLNPHVYLDTVVLLGSISSRYPVEERTFFALGACTASTLWFFTLSTGASRLAPVFKNPNSWKILDLVICCTMWSIAYQILPV